ncbi:hypothetical protein, partial [Salmonella sp. s51090]|uniref:hypothetical protein n=1 Tax=Salmonella sp. s51090 TaxID=3159651 RepID=UPI00397F113C
MSSNLVGGMLQRLDKMRKHAFGNMLIIGENNKNQISGVWLWRGQDRIFDLDENWQVDSESYKWTRLDVTKQSDRDIVTKYFTWEGDFGGK